jgi:DNA-dependent RNA polymerase auxiliary subunit epsilon
MKIYQYGELNLFFVMAVSEKRGLNFGAFFIDLTKEDINAVKFLNEKYLYVINNIIEVDDRFLNYETTQMIPAIKPGRLALELIQKSSRVRKK